MAINGGNEGADTQTHSSVKWRQGQQGVIQNTATALERPRIMTTALLPLYPKSRLTEYFKTHHSAIPDRQPAE